MEKEKGRFVSWRALVIGIAISVVVNMIFGMSMGAGGWAPGVGVWSPNNYPSRLLHWGNLYVAVSAVFIVCILFSIINSIGKKPLLTKEEIVTIVFMAGFSFALVQAPFASPIQSMMGLGIGSQINIARGLFTKYDLIAYGGTGFGYWCPSDTQLVIYAWENSTWNINWGAWILPIAFSVLHTIAFALIFMFIQFIFVAPLVTVESLPVPGVQIFTEEIELVRSEASAKLPFFKKKALWLGFVLSSAVAIPFLISIGAWSPTITYPPPLMPFTQIFEMDYSSLFAIPGTQISVIWWPTYVAWGLLWPWEVLLTFTLIVFLQAYALGPLFVAIGYWPASNNFGNRRIAELWTGQSTWQIRESGVPYMFGFFFCTGILLAIIIYPLWRARANIGPIFTALFKKGSTLDELDKKAPLPYRYAWIGLIGSFLLYLGLSTLLQLPVVSTAFYLVLLVLFWIGLGRVFAEANYGGMVEAGYSGYGHVRELTDCLGQIVMESDLTIARPTVPTPASAQAFNYYQYGYQISEQPVYFIGAAMPLYGMKLADIYSVDKRKMFIAALVSIITICVVSAFAFVILFHVGDWVTPTRTVFFARTYTYGLPQTWWGMGTFLTMTSAQITRGIATLAIAFIISIAMYIGKERVKMLGWLSVTGFFIAMLVPWRSSTNIDPWGVDSIVWPLIAIIIRWVAIRTKGATWTNDNIIPFAVGLFVGFALWTPFLMDIGIYFHQMGWYGAPL